MDWTGSSSQRREQGICLPPSHEPDVTAKFTIPVGTVVYVCRVSDSKKAWSQYRTKEELGFHRYETYRSFRYTFRHLGYFIRVPVGKVKKLRTR